MMRSAMLFAGALLLAGAAPQPDTGPLTNPLLPSGADPYIVREGADYYYMHTLGDRIEIWHTRDLANLARADRRVAWKPSKPGPNVRSLWAPEMHRINGRWYIYFTAAETTHDDDAHRGVFVLENASPDPMRGKWIDRGRVNTAHPGIDGTVFEHAGKRYFAYSPYVGPDSDIAIAEMVDPLTIRGETIIAAPDRPWERQGGRQILEGPAFLPSQDGTLYLSYSGSACWSDGYAIGLLQAKPGADPLDAKAWSKAPAPVMATTPAGNVFAPGHNGFFTSPSGDNWIVYHANPRAGMRCGAARAPHIQRIDWDAKGAPVFPAPAAGAMELRP